MTIVTFDERLGWLLVGCTIGFIVGYIVRALRDIKEEIHEVDTLLKKQRDESGFVRPSFANIAIAVVVLLTAWAAIQSQSASNKSNQTSVAILGLQVQMRNNLNCTTQVLFDAVNALNERTTYSGSQADTNIDLVQAQFDLITKGSKPGLTEAEQKALFQNYINQVKSFLDVAGKNRVQLNAHPYPTVQDLASCLQKANSKEN